MDEFDTEIGQEVARTTRNEVEDGLKGRGGRDTGALTAASVIV